jgi:glucose/arabinose dehydrogenase
MSIPKIFTALAAISVSLGAQETTAQVTYGKKPELPAPFATKSAGNGPEKAKPPEGFLPTAPAGFHVNLFADGFSRPRFLAVAPNGDLFVADTGAGKVLVLRDPQHSGRAQDREIFAENLIQPFGIAFRDDYVYVGNMKSLVRFHYNKTTSKRTGEEEKLMDLPGGGHSTRTVAFSADGTKLFISIGSESNIDIEKDQRRGAVLVADPDGKNARIYASGLRNAVGLAIEPLTRAVWVSVNERDELGDNLPPDFFTSLEDGGFYGWPYSYIGGNVDPRVLPQKPELVARAIIPDVLLGAHVAPLEFAFYTGKQFPEGYQGGAFIAEHGSWNRAARNGYEVAFVGFKDGKANADPVPFMTGLVPDPSGKSVYGRPVGVAVATDGSLLVSDDGAGVIYRISYGK